MNFEKLGFNPETEQGIEGGVELPTKPLTETELKIARLVTEGLTDKEIAEKLKISKKTVQYHLKKILDKLEIPKVRNGRFEGRTRLGITLDRIEENLKHPKLPKRSLDKADE